MTKSTLITLIFLRNIKNSDGNDNTSGRVFRDNSNIFSRNSKRYYGQRTNRSRKLIQYNSKKIAMNKKVTSPKQIRFTDTRIKAKHFCKHFIQSVQQEKFR